MRWPPHLVLREKLPQQALCAGAEVHPGICRGRTGKRFGWLLLGLTQTIGAAATGLSHWGSDGGGADRWAAVVR